MRKSIIKIAALSASIIFLGVGLLNNIMITNELRSVAVLKSVETVKKKPPKYIFLFIGDGMSYPQIQLTADYLGRDNQGVSSSSLSFMNFPVVGNAQTYSANSYITDSAAAGTAFASGHKTNHGTLNLDPQKKNKFVTIAEQLKAQKDYKIGVVTTVNLNHATPAAFYAHQASRTNYYEIGKELIASNFNYFAGGALVDPNGKGKDQESLYQAARKSGYRIAFNKQDAEALTSQTGKSIIVSETLADAGSLPYAGDMKKDQWGLRDYVKKGIDLLENDKGFFMMVEGGKIDWAGHANDAGSVINETAAFADAVEEAILFYDKYPEDTLILVTGDHESGGLTLGYNKTHYETYLNNFDSQKISFAKFKSDYVTEYKKDKTEIGQVLKDIEKNFGLTTKENSGIDTSEALILTDSETAQIKAAYEKIIAQDSNSRTEEELLLYGGHDPLTVTVTRILANKSGLDFTTFDHTGIPVPVFAKGASAYQFGGYYDNTDIYKKLIKLTLE